MPWRVRFHAAMPPDAPLPMMTTSWTSGLFGVASVLVLRMGAALEFGEEGVAVPAQLLVESFAATRSSRPRSCLFAMLEERICWRAE